MTEVRALVDGRQLAKELKWLKRVAGTRRSVIDGYVKIEVTDFVVNLTTVNRLDYILGSTVSLIPEAARQRGSFCLSIVALEKLVRKTKGYVGFFHDGAVAQIELDGMACQLQSYDTDTFEGLPEFLSNDTRWRYFPITKQIAARIKPIVKTNNYIFQDRVLVETDSLNRNVRFVATDGYRLSISDSDPLGPTVANNAERVEFVLSNGAIQTLANFAGAEWTHIFENDMCYLWAANRTMIAYTTNRKEFITYDKIVDQLKRNYTITIQDRLALVSTLEQLALSTGENRTPLVKLTFSQGVVRLDCGNASMVSPTLFCHGLEHTIEFDLRNLIHGLKTMESDSVTWDGEDSRSPQSFIDNQNLYVLMPMSTNKATQPTHK